MGIGMDNSELAKMVDSDRWLLNNGLVSDAIKNQLFFCGSIVHRDVQAVEVQIRPESKLVNYTIYVTSGLLKKVAKYHKLSTTTSLWGMWQFKRLLKKEGCLDFQKVLSSFVTDYCGHKWSATAKVLGFDEYVDSLEGLDEEGGGDSGDKPPDAG